MPINRRTFLQSSLLCLGAMGSGFPMASPMSHRRLLLIELKGGNDGLNTVIPYSDPNYRRLRPQLAVARDKILQLTEQTALHPSLETLMPAWQKNEFAIIQGLGYPQPNRSHFRSIAIWETASASNEYLKQG